MSGFLDSFYLLGSIGDRAEDTDAERLKHRLLVYMGILMSGGGVLWGSISAFYELWIPALVPYGYVVITVFNLLYFRASKNFVTTRFVQVMISLLLPFLFQWSLGGFISSGGVMLWAMLALVGSLTFTDSRSAWQWLFMYVALTVVSGVVDEGAAARFSANPSPHVVTAFFVTNLTVISSIVFGLMIYVLGQRERANTALTDANQRVQLLNEHLEDEVAARTSELEESLGRFRAILNNMADGMVALDKTGKIQAANPALKELLYVSGELDEEALPSSITDLAEESVLKDETIKTEIPLPGERFGAAVASPIHRGEGSEKSAVGSVVIVRDVTLEREIDRMKTDFIATVSHELRTPLTSVLGFAKLTKNKLEGAVFDHVPEDDKKAQRAVKQVRGNIDIIVSEGERLTTLINDVLDISKMEAGHMEWKMEPFDPAALAKHAAEAASGLFSNSAVKLVTAIEEPLPTLSGDYDRLLQVILNLLSNASKFTDEGVVTLSAKMTGEGVQISVTDTGDGIEKTDQSSVFEKFKQVGDTLTNKPKGTGLGLPICRQIVAAHGGRIWVESEKDQGATFSFIVPTELSVATQTPRTVDALVNRIERHIDRALPELGGDILVVDDDMNLRELLRQQLADRGYTVRLAENGYSAIQAVRARRPDLVILDVMMPDISGFDVAAVLRADPETTNIPIIILSIIQDTDRGYKLGVESYMTKPTDAEVLLVEIQRVLKSSRSRQNVLVVDDGGSGIDFSILENRGYVLVGHCSGGDCVTKARETKPDVIILGSHKSDGEELIRHIRKERGLEHVHVVQLMDEGKVES